MRFCYDITQIAEQSFLGNIEKYKNIFLKRLALSSHTQITYYVVN